MKPKWKRDGAGDYSLALPSGASAWIAKGAGTRNQPSWYGQAFIRAGESARISAWTLGVAKQKAEKALEIE